MTGHIINIYNRQKKILPEKKLKESIRACVLGVLHEEGFFERAQVDISFVSDKEIRKYNKEFRDKDAVTDVLSFPVLEFDEGYNPIGIGGDTDLNNNAVLLGDVVISLERAACQAQQYGHSFLREVCFLTVHSMYHLLGYDHEEEEERAVMRLKEELVLSALGIMRNEE